MSTRTTAARRSVVTGLLALAVLGGTAASGVGVTAAVAAPAASSSSSQVPTTTRTTDFGYLTKIVRSSSGRRLVLDRAIMHVGAEAAAQRARRGLEPADYYIQNDNPMLRTFRVRPGVKVYGSQHLTGSPARKPASLATLERYLRTTPKARRAPFTLRYDRQGRVVEIAEFYLP
jgi:hypothetical protein